VTPPAVPPPAVTVPPVPVPATPPAALPGTPAVPPAPVPPVAVPPPAPPAVTVPPVVPAVPPVTVPPPAPPVVTVPATPPVPVPPVPPPAVPVLAVPVPAAEAAAAAPGAGVSSLPVPPMGAGGGGAPMSSAPALPRLPAMPGGSANAVSGSGSGAGGNSWDGAQGGIGAALIALLVLVAAGMKGSDPPAPANIRTASSTTQVTLASTLSVAAAPKTVARPVSGYAVRPGDTLSGIAARFAVRGGWPALYAANRPLIGSDPDVIRPGTVLVLPGRMAPARYTVVSGDTLAGIAVRLAVRGGWPALYAANRPVIGSDPDVIRPGIVLAVRRRRGGRSAAEEAGIVLADYDRVVVTCSQPADTVYVLRPPGADPREILRVARLVLPEDLYRELAGQLGMPAGWPIVVADHDRVVVTWSQPADTCSVLRPPGPDPREILRVARLVVPEVPYGELADQLGVPASWPMEKEVPAEA